MTGALIALGVVVVAYAAWRISVWRWPTRRCPSCNGSGRNGGSNALRWGTCRRCGGKGDVPRLGAPRQ